MYGRRKISKEARSSQCEGGFGRKMRWPYPFFPCFFLSHCVLGRHKSRGKSHEYMQKTIKGDHMLLLRDEIYGFSSSFSSILCEMGKNDSSRGEFSVKLFGLIQ